MTRINHRGWMVVQSVQTLGGDLCIDFFERPTGGFGFEQLRRDAEDRGGWTQISAYSSQHYASLADAVDAAEQAVVWLTDDPSARNQLSSWRTRDADLFTS